MCVLLCRGCGYELNAPVADVASCPECGLKGPILSVGVQPSAWTWKAVAGRLWPTISACSLTAIIAVIDAALLLGDRGSVAAQLLCLFLLMFAMVFAYAWPVFYGPTRTLGARAALQDAPTTVSIITGAVMTGGFALIVLGFSPLFRWVW